MKKFFSRKPKMWAHPDQQWISHQYVEALVAIHENPRSGKDIFQPMGKLLTRSIAQQDAEYLQRPLIWLILLGHQNIQGRASDSLTDRAWDLLNLWVDEVAAVALDSENATREAQESIRIDMSPSREIVAAMVGKGMKPGKAPKVDASVSALLFAALAVLAVLWEDDPRELETILAEAAVIQAQGSVVP